MRTTLVHLTPVLALATLVAACDSDPTGAGQASFLQATLQSVPTNVTGAVTVEHRGSAGWHGGHKTNQRHLSISSTDTEAQRTMSLRWLSSEPEGFFQEGVYSLVPRNFNAGDNDGYTALYLDHKTGTHYIAESGTWTITDVDAETQEVTGHFEFVVANWCNVHNDRERCLLQSPKNFGFSSGAERLTVRGEFRAEGHPPYVDIY